MLKPALKALTDTRFELWLTPRLVRWLYLACMAVFAGAGLFSFLWWWWLAAWLNSWMFAVMMPVSVLACLAGILAVRVTLEAALIRFKPPAPRPAPAAPVQPLRPHPHRPSPPPVRTPAAPRPAPRPVPAVPDELTRPDMGHPSPPPRKPAAAQEKRVWP